MSSKLPIEWIDFAGHVGYLLLCAGTYGVARKRTWGWYARIAGETVWTVLGVELRLTSVFFWGLVGACIDSYGLYRFMR